MSRRLIIAFARGLGILAVVYLPTFVLVSVITVATTGGGEEGPPPVETATPLVIGISLVIALILMATAGRRRFSSFGFRASSAGSLGMSLILGLMLGSLVSWLSLILNVELPNVAALATWQVIAFLWIGAPIQEELIFRGLLQGIVGQSLPDTVRIARWRYPPAALLSASMFAGVHLALLGVGASPGAAAFIVAGALVLGLMAGHLRWSTGSLLPCFLLHALFNVTGSAIGWLSSPQ